ncbi:MAG: nitronate monooxygenase [Bacteroidales bacterium]|nr:nitronate monooxygenase [Bacteroidales bacterium]
MRQIVKTTFTEMLGIEHPVLVAPMFLISNSEMVIAALEAGATAAIPALNYRSEEAMIAAISEIRQKCSKPFGFNLIVNKSNPKFLRQLEVLCQMKVDYIITSLGSPEEVIKRCKPLGIKVFCDVVNLEYAKKVEALGADALIAVNSSAGGHCGPLPSDVLIPLLVKNCNIPVISAGGVGKGKHIKQALELGASGVSVGTLFIASDEAPVSAEYKQALIDFSPQDIVLTSRLSGTPLTVINTPYVRQIGTKPSFLEVLMKKYPFFKKQLKLLIAFRGMKKIEKSAFKATYKTVWCAGPSIGFITKIRPLKEIVQTLMEEFNETQDN